MKVLVTGVGGFIGRNLSFRLREAGHEVLPVTRQTGDAELREMIGQAEAVVHLAGANRPETADDFTTINDRFTAHVCELLIERDGRVPVIAASTCQIERDNPYGRSKRAAENHLCAMGKATSAPVAICRLVNVFGKWGLPEYNSVVNTYCHHIARDQPIRIDDPAARLRLVHVDDVIDGWLSWLAAPLPGVQVTAADPEYQTTLQELADQIRSYRALRDSHTVGETGTGLGRVLYATYVSYLPTEAFAYPLSRHCDHRGVFAEMLRTETSGQFSFFTAWPGITRGGHYHHVKTEKFLVLKGRARFRFKHIDTGETFAIETRGEESMIVESVPGWSHDITNIGDDELLCMLWANELFDNERPDTVAHPLTDEA